MGLTVEGLLGRREFAGKLWRDVSARWRLTSFRAEEDASNVGGLRRDVVPRVVGSWTAGQGLSWVPIGVRIAFFCSRAFLHLLKFPGRPGVLCSLS